MIKRQLKVGFLIGDSYSIPAWEYEILKQLINSDFAVVTVFMQLRDVKQLREKGQKKLNSNNGLPFMYKVFKKFEDWWFASNWDASTRLDISEIIKHKEIISLDSSNPLELRYEKLENHQLDIIYRSHSVQIPKEILFPAAYGIWSIHLAPHSGLEKILPGFWEVMNHTPVTSSFLKATRSETEEILLYEGITQTIPYSAKNNFNHLAWKSSSFLAYRLRELFMLGPDIFFNKYKSTQPTLAEDYSDVVTPGNLKMISLFVNNFASYIVCKIRKIISKRNFCILYSIKTSETNNPNFIHLKKIKPPKNTFWADPFIIKKGVTSYIFFEEFIIDKKKGHISVIILDKQGLCESYRKVLERPYHLSYPFIFEVDGSYYMIPETSSNKTVELYRSSDFPFEWKLAMTLMENITLIDVTLHYFRNKWWLFGSTRNHPFTTANDQLMIYYCENLFSKDWIPHPQNPVVTDISNCRPAGKIFISEETKLYRPAQNNASLQYGHGIKINEILVLNETQYEEKAIYHISPENSPGFIAMHTINTAENITVIDGITNRRIISANKVLENLK